MKTENLFLVVTQEGQFLRSQVVGRRAADRAANSGQAKMVMPLDFVMEAVQEKMQSSASHTPFQTSGEPSSYSGGDDSLCDQVERIASTKAANVRLMQQSGTDPKIVQACGEQVAATLVSAAQLSTSFRRATDLRINAAHVLMQIGSTQSAFQVLMDANRYPVTNEAKARIIRMLQDLVGLRRDTSGG